MMNDLGTSPEPMTFGPKNYNNVTQGNVVRVTHGVRNDVYINCSVCKPGLGTVALEELHDIVEWTVAGLNRLTFSVTE